MQCPALASFHVNASRQDSAQLLHVNAQTLLGTEVWAMPRSRLINQSGIRRNARTSTGARQATTALRPHASASSRLAASSTQKPPMCSLVSRYGPSVMSTLPPGCARRDLALLAGVRAPAKILAPAAALSSLSPA